CSSDLEVTQVPDQGHIAHGRDLLLPGGAVHRALLPPGRRLPGHASLRQLLRSVVRGEQSRLLLGVEGRQLLTGGDGLEPCRRRVLRVLTVVTAVDRVLEQVTLPGLTD